MLYVWKYEYERWTGNKAVIIKKDAQHDKLTKEDAIIMSYGKLSYKNKMSEFPHLERVLKHKPTAFVCDEAHILSNRDTNYNITCTAVSRIVDTCIVATGTPARDKPWNVWGILHVMDPKRFTSYWNFIGSYFYTVTSVFSRFGTPEGFKAGKEQELAEMLSNCAIQRKRSELRDWELKIEPINVVLPCTKLQRNIITSLEETFEYKDIVTKTILDNLIRIRQVCADPRILIETKETAPKTEWILDYIKECQENKVLLFTLSRKYLELLANVFSGAGIPYDCIHGDVTPKKRAEIVDKFQSGNCKYLLIQTQTGKEGLTLDTADTTIFIDTYPPAAMYEQAKDRMVAVSEEREKPKQIFHLMMEDTYDAILYDLVENNINESYVINDYKNYIERRKNGESRNSNI